MKLTLERWQVGGTPETIHPTQIQADVSMRILVESKTGVAGQVVIFEDEDGYLSAKLFDIDLEL